MKKQKQKRLDTTSRLIEAPAAFFERSSASLYAAPRQMPEQA